ncbi:hypothetical protein PR048_022581 [Dryococelus australis]|uniref:Uncharacterized protein n=1 Tax=Dryococelus australis TaxID=614101 RepID=A0ABQ9H1C9_9NEOP|nr:hypothetical protein PR048_022581 [Dryococelus australis]
MAICTPSPRQYSRTTNPVSTRPLGFTTPPATLCSHTTRLPPKRTWFDPRRGHLRISACGDRWLAGFLGGLPFLLLFHLGAAPYSRRFTLIGSQDVDVMRRPNLFPHSLHSVYEMSWQFYQRGVAVLERLDCSPPTKANLVQSPAGENRAGLSRWSAGFLRDLPFPLLLQSGVAPCSYRFTLSGSRDLILKKISFFHWRCHSQNPTLRCSLIHPRLNKKNACLMGRTDRDLNSSFWMGYFCAVHFRQFHRCVNIQPTGGSSLQSVTNGNAATIHHDILSNHAASARPTSSGEDLGMTRPGLEPGSPWWEASRLTAWTPRSLRTKRCGSVEWGHSRQARMGQESCQLSWGEDVAGEYRMTPGGGPRDPGRRKNTQPPATSPAPLATLCIAPRMRPITSAPNKDDRAHSYVAEAGIAGKALDFHQGEPGSILGGHVGIVLEDAAGWLVSYGIPRFPRPCIPALLRTHLTSPPSAIRTSILRVTDFQALGIHNENFVEKCIA